MAATSGAGRYPEHGVPDSSESFEDSEEDPKKVRSKAVSLSALRERLVEPSSGTNTSGGGGGGGKTAAALPASAQDIHPHEVLDDPTATITVSSTNGKLPGEQVFRVRLEFACTAAAAAWLVPDMEGTLLLQVGRLNRYKPRHCVLQGSKFFCFKEKPLAGEAPKLTVNLLQGSLAIDVGRNRSGSISSAEIAKAKQPLYKFGVTQREPKEQTHVLGTRDAEEARQWMTAISRATEAAGDDESELRVFDDLTVTFSPSEGFVGLPQRWKIVLLQAHITERQFYEETDSVVEQLRQVGVAGRLSLFVFGLLT
jgi:PH domain